MEIALVKAVREALCAGLNEHGGGFLPEQICLCPRAAAASCYVGDGAGDPAKRSGGKAGLTFPNVLNAPLVDRTWEKDGWLLFALTDAFYDAAVEAVVRLLPYPPEDGGNYAQNRMMALARKPRTGVPKDASVQRAVWLAICMTARPSLQPAAERALLTMGGTLSPALRSGLLQQCGSVGNAAARLLHTINQ